MRRDFAIAASFDTETTNLGSGDSARAFACLYVFDDLRGIDLRAYYPDDPRERVLFMRTCDEAIAYVGELVAWGLSRDVVPVVCAYNLMFDLQTLLFALSRGYGMRANAQSATNAYTVDLLLDDDVVLRFWDTYHLEMGGLAAMGETCGLPKARGDWDYSRVRTPETPLTDAEIFYAKRDVQVIPAYLRYLLDANEWMEPRDLGSSVLTKTSIVRQMAKREIGGLRFVNSHGHRMTLLRSFEATCMRQLPRSYHQYALRKACFRGGWTFTAAGTASMVVENVASLDVTSMHHAFVNGRYVPIDFAKRTPDALAAEIRHVLSRTRDDVLSRYHRPFDFAFHARIRFTGLRLRDGSCFERWKIGLIPEGKFAGSPARGAEYGLDDRARVAEAHARAAGWHDVACEPNFAFGKLMSADWCVLHVTEVELWTISRVYEWDGLEPILGEGTRKHRRPPDYVTLQSNALFEVKSAAKRICASYAQGVPYDGDMPESVPDGIARSLRDGTCDARFMSSYYNSTVKGMFNGIYGTQAQDVFKPSYAVTADGELEVDRSTVVTAATWDDSQPDRCRVLYTYGMRIVGGSRMHLCIAMELLHDALGDAVTVTGGDTDSLKVSCAPGVTDDDMLDALSPLHYAVTAAIARTMEAVRRDYPKLASTLDGVGCFEVERCGDGTRYPLHMEAWNKARVSMDTAGKCHVTCAGLSRPRGAYHIEDWLDGMLANGVPFERLAPLALGYNVHVSHGVCHALQRTSPRARDVVDEVVIDYMGGSCRVVAPEAIALYPSGREIADTSKRGNAENVAYLRSMGRDIDVRIRSVEVERDAAGDLAPVLKAIDPEGVTRI